MRSPFPELPQSAESSAPHLLDVHARPSMGPLARQAKFEAPLQILWRRKWVALFLAAALCTTIVTYVSTLPNIYKAEATVLVERRQEGIEVDSHHRLTVLTQQILSYDRLAELIERFHLYADLRGLLPLEDIVARMRNDIQLQQQESTQRRGKHSVTAFSLSYQGQDPVKIADITNTLTDFYIKANVKSRSEEAWERTRFLQDQLEQTQTQLEAQEREISLFKEKHIGELPEQLSANLATLERLNEQLRLNSGKLAQTQEHRANLLQQKTNAIQHASQSPVAPDSTQQQLEALYQRLSELQGLYTERHPDVIHMKAQIADFERRQAGRLAPMEGGAKQLPSISPPVMSSTLQLNEVNAAIKALETEERNLRASIEHYQTRVAMAPRIERQLQRLIRTYNITEERYLSLRKRYEEANMVRTIEQHEQGERFEVLVPATPPKAPIAPKRKQFYLAGLALSLAFGAGLVFLRDKMDSSFHVVEDLRAFAPVPVLVSLPRIETPVDLRRKRWRYGVNTVAALLFLYALCVSTYAFATGGLPPHLRTLPLSWQTYFLWLTASRDVLPTA